MMATIGGLPLLSIVPNTQYQNKYNNEGEFYVCRNWNYRKGWGSECEGFDERW
jgi:hypothetical protein